MKTFSTRAAIAAAATLGLTGVASAHEAWLLTPQEMFELAAAPKPAIFTNVFYSAPLVAALAAVVFGAVVSETRWQAIENRVMRPLADRVGDLGPLAVRIGLAIMLFAASLGLLPAPNVAIGTAPTLFVPDMQLKLLVDAWGFLALVQVLLSLVLVSGIGTRFAGLGVALLAVLGLGLFGETFIAYAGHFFVPGLYLAFAGAGRFRLSLPAAVAGRLPASTLLDRLAVTPTVYRVLMAIFGANFAYLGIAYKLMHPTMLVAILEHGEFPNFGIDYGVIVFVMTFVEVSAGLLLVAGILVRPIAIFLISAFTMFALTLGETPLFHANLYAMAFVLLMAGAGSRSTAARRLGLGIQRMIRRKRFARLAEQAA
ncbi:hypothetical protein [Jiella marina]|uniref:hypothetical protein n=1 Tax=Jiella sp. LLJ827 TaxID=2917712 RepID=UPI002101A920|nr:hypothetical protein [Jiella sp. LLJ827]MCQ0988357.1 hypothetical protein [Jiella sp. LLJ827]